MKGAWKAVIGLATVVCLVIGLPFTSSIIVANPGLAVSIEAPTQVGEDVDALMIKVSVGNDGNTVSDLDSAQFDITYDKAVLHVTNVVSGQIGGKAVHIAIW